MIYLLFSFIRMENFKCENRTKKSTFEFFWSNHRYWKSTISFTGVAGSISISIRLLSVSPCQYYWQWEQRKEVNSNEFVNSFDSCSLAHSLAFPVREQALLSCGRSLRTSFWLSSFHYLKISRWQFFIKYSENKSRKSKPLSRSGNLRDFLPDYFSCIPRSNTYGDTSTVEISKGHIRCSNVVKNSPFTKIYNFENSKFR